MIRLKQTISIVLFGFVLSFIISCTKIKNETGFYYWKTSFDLKPSEKKLLRDLQVKNLYLRMFDVDISAPDAKPVPVAAIKGLDTSGNNLYFIPVVFITNRTFFKLSKPEVSQLAKNVYRKLNSILGKYNELQIDCDWSGQSRENYFLFLQEIKNLVRPAGIELSCTIRLHQVKYAAVTGVPPVDRGMLMFYNMGNVRDVNEVNSIYTEAIAAKYTGFLKSYALPLDVVLPIFRWQAHYRNNKLINLLSKKNCLALSDTGYFTQVKNSKFEIRKSGIINNMYFKQGDILREEKVDEALLKSAAGLLNNNLEHKSRRIVFYDLDEVNIGYYDKNVFEKITAVFN